MGKGRVTCVGELVLSIDIKDIYELLPNEYIQFTWKLLEEFTTHTLLLPRPFFTPIYSASWGPLDDGITVEGPGRLASAALKIGTSKVSYCITYYVISTR